jgi:hypothetical protein
MVVLVDSGAGHGVVPDVEDVEIDKGDNHEGQKGTRSDSERY